MSSPPIEGTFPGLIFALNLDGKGGATAVDPTMLTAELTKDTLSWVHLDYSAPGITDWLQHIAGLDEVAVAALTGEEPRPRCIPHGDGLLMILRGINHTPNADREDMVSIRIWINQHSIISMRQRRLKSATAIKALLNNGHGPENQGEVIVALVGSMCEYIGEAIADLDERMDNVEEAVMTMERGELRRLLGDLRRETIVVRRYLSPQRDALSNILLVKRPWLSDVTLMQLRELADRTIRFVEDLDAIRDRAMVTQEELNFRIAERMNRIMFFLSIVTGVFLPLGLLTGLLGINVGGMPGADNASAFWMVCGLLAVIAGAELWLFKKMKWF